MDEQRPYEKNDLHFSQLPDADKAWAHMKAKLDEEDRRRRFILPPFITGCGGWGLLLLLVVGGGLWWYFAADKGTETTTQENKIVDSRIAEKITTQKAGENTNAVAQKKETPVAPLQPSSKGKTNNLLVADESINVTHQQQRQHEKIKQPRSKKTPSKAATTRAVQKKPKGKTNVSAPVENEFPAQQQPAEEKPVTTALDQNITRVEKDSTINMADSVEAPKNADSVVAPKPVIKRENKRFIIAAGLSLQQQLPVAGQQWTPYNYHGRRGSLADYVPAVDVRLYKEDKWYVQAGFRYGAPQYTREFVYSKNYKTDTFGVVQSSTAYRLKKTYYHQVPVSFNYFVKPRWSVGAGVVYNKFFGAVSEKEDRQQVTPTTDTLVSKAIVRDRTDSIFRSSNMQLLLQTQYQWKRFSVGARFTQGLQPFIEYTDAQGQKQKQKSHAVNLFIRYELWRQKK